MWHFVLHLPPRGLSAACRPPKMPEVPRECVGAAAPALFASTKNSRIGFAQSLCRAAACDVSRRLAQEEWLSRPQARMSVSRGKGTCPDDRRAFVPGGTGFFTLNLLQSHGNDLLVREIALSGETASRVRSHPPFRIDAWDVLPDHVHWVWILSPGDSDFSRRWQLIQNGFLRALSKTEHQSDIRQAAGEGGRRIRWHRVWSLSGECQNFCLWGGEGLFHSAAAGFKFACLALNLRRMSDLGGIVTEKRGGNPR